MLKYIQNLSGKIYHRYRNREALFMVTLVFEHSTDIHWMKDVVQFPLALADESGIKGAEIITRPNNKQGILSTKITLRYFGYPIKENFSKYENADFHEINGDYKWYHDACSLASKSSKVLILYPFYGNHFKGARVYKIKRWLRGKRATVVLKSDGTLRDLAYSKVNFYKRLLFFFKFFFIDFIVCENLETFCSIKRQKLFLLNKLVYLPNCPLSIYNTQLPAQFDNRENAFLFVGRINDYEKGADILLEAWGRVNNELSGWRLYMVGPCTEEFKKEWVNKFQHIFEENVIWLGNQDPEKLLRLYNKVKIVVTPSRKEGVPIVLSEAVLSGCAFIGTSVGEIPDMLDGLPGLVSDSDDLGKTLIEFAGNDDILKFQSSVLKERVKDRNWRLQASKIKI